MPNVSRQEFTVIDISEDGFVSTHPLPLFLPGFEASLMHFGPYWMVMASWMHECSWRSFCCACDGAALALCTGQLVCGLHARACALGQRVCELIS